MYKQDRQTMSIAKGDIITLPNEDGVMTGYAVERIFGNIEEVALTLRNANIPAITREIKITRGDG